MTGEKLQDPSKRVFVLGGLTLSATAIFDGFSNRAFATGESPEYRRELITFLIAMRIKYKTEVDEVIELVKGHRFTPGAAGFTGIVEFKKADWWGTEYPTLKADEVSGIKLCITKFRDGQIQVTLRVADKRGSDHSHNVPTK